MTHIVSTYLKWATAIFILILCNTNALAKLYLRPAEPTAPYTGEIEIIVLGPTGEVLFSKIAADPTGKHEVRVPGHLQSLGVEVIFRGVSSRSIRVNWLDLSFVRRGLETERSRKMITEEEYQNKDRQIAAQEEAFAIAISAVLSNRARPAAAIKITRSPSYKLPTNDVEDAKVENVSTVSSASIQWVQFLYERKTAIEDLHRKVINRAEYEDKVKEILAKERKWAQQHPLSNAEMDQYHVLLDRIQADIAELEKTFTSNKPLTEQLAPWATMCVALLGTVLTYHLGRRKDLREKREIEMKEAKLESELRDLRLKNEQLEQQVTETRMKTQQKSKLIIGYSRHTSKNRT